ncbi:hypothetical protein MKW94_024263 [Papaver nudicaule]|uniref:SPARK domain-containing protein n=1 Tax=Papaver nudicaule TaxID=74823 RepID=A0AA41V7S6_PAPNU|nr:hypothetical protein [Papaver nudicaule]
MSFQIFFFISLLFLHESIALPIIPQPEPSSSSPIQSFHPTPTLPSTIPAFPEQSNLAGCPLNLPQELFTSINQACNSNKGGKDSHHHYLSKSKCCPVLAAWLYSAYSDTALNRATRMTTTTSYDPLPILPDDSETCVDNLDKALKSKGIELIKPNQTCDLVFCYCGIRLPPLSCTEAFSTSSSNGVSKLVGDKSVQKLEKDCLNHNNNNGGSYSSSHSGCSKCLNSLYKLNGDTHVNKTDSKSKMHGRGCELMGLTWLLGKNRTAYMPTVTSVLRALMMNKGDSEPRSCSLTSEGLPLAVDSAELNDQSSSPSLNTKSPINLLIIVSMSFSYVFSLLALF